MPAEALIDPGEKVTFKTRLFNELGQLIKESDAVYSVAGPAQIDKNGTLVADAAGRPFGGHRHGQGGRAGRHGSRTDRAAAAMEV